MKKWLLVLLVLFCAFAAFAADATLGVTLTVNEKAPLFGFRSEPLNSYSESPGSLTSDQSFDTSDLNGLVGHDNVYAVVTTNSANTGASYSLAWSDFSATDAGTTIPLTINVSDCIINTTTITSWRDKTGTSAGAKNEGGNDTASIELTEPEESTVKGARAINFKLDMYIKNNDYNAAAASAQYKTTLTFGVTAP